MGKIKGLIWYADGYYAGTEEDFQTFIKTRRGGKVVFTFDEIKYDQLVKLCENLNLSNAKRVNIEEKDY
ncbi:MAG: hypothetical protein ACFHWX_05515 [Bacteroidota bacterium]